METMEVVALSIPPATMASAISSIPSAYLSAPASPRRFDHPSNCGFYASAPASPSRIAAALFQEQDLPVDDWERESSAAGDVDDHGGDIDWEAPFDFANGFSGHLDKDGRLAVPDLATADELFEQGVIRPLNLQAEAQPWDVRGRRASTASISDAVSSRCRRASRSLSPIRGKVTAAPAAGEDKEYLVEAAAMQKTVAPAANSALVKGGGGSKKWRLMDMLLFRSASEGRATGRGSKDPLCRFSVSRSSSPSSSFLPSLFGKRKPVVQEDASNAGSRSGGSTRRGRSTTSYPSVHAMHLAASRAASEEMRKKAPLPYHQNTLFGYMRHNLAIQSISRQFNNS